MKKLSIAVHKFSSCDGCQLALLNLGEQLLTLLDGVQCRHFAEAGIVNPDAQVDVALVEGSISTPEDCERIKRVRANSEYLVSIGACATSGGIQALRNTQDGDGWTRAIYADPRYISSLALSTPLAENVRVDYELWGCPVSTRQLLALLNSLRLGVKPHVPRDKLCGECKRSQTVCVLVTRGLPCLGPVTNTGCGALCPRFGRDCYGCFGPGENVNGEGMSECLRGLGLPARAIERRYHLIHSHLQGKAAGHGK